MAETREGIVVQCIGCKRKQHLTFEEAGRLSDIPFCEFCLLPMVAIEASVKGKTK